jgi:Na+/H+ antiporter NhaD/arsenite permease-like protein
MWFEMSAYLKMLAWFAVAAALAGLGVSAWINTRPGTQRLFEEVEEPATKEENGREPIAARSMWTVSAALTLGVLIGYLLGQLLAIQAHAQSLAHATFA